MYERTESVLESSNRLLGLIDTIYAAVQEPQLWSSVLADFAETIRGEATILVAPFAEQPVVAMARINPDAWDAYVHHVSAINPLATHCDRIFPDGTTRYSHLAMTDSDMEKTEFYNDFFRHYDMYYSMGLNVPLANAPVAYFSSMRPRHKGPFEEAEGRIYQTLLPHLQRALSLHQQMSRARCHVQGLEAAVDAFDQVVFGLSAEGKIVLQSGRAEAILHSGDGLRISRGRLILTDSTQNAKLQSAIREIASGAFRGALPNHALLVRRRAGTPLQLTIAPYRSSLPGVTALTALVFLADPLGRHRSSRESLLRSLYALSPTEAHIADLIAQGLTIGNIAAQLRLSVETVRFHTKRVFSKTGVRRQAELVKIVLSLPHLENRPHDPLLARSQATQVSTGPRAEESACLY